MRGQVELQDPRERPVNKQQAADEAHRRFADENSDFISYLKLWDFYHQLKENLSRNQLRKAIAQNFLSLNRLRNRSETYRQLRQIVEQSGRKIYKRRDDYGAIHRSLLTGLLSGVAYRSEAYQYTGAGGNKSFLWPGSGTFAKRPKWIVAAEMVETSRRYARTVAHIDPEWIEPLAMHLVKRRYVAPFWSRKPAHTGLRKGFTFRSANCHSTPRPVRSRRRRSRAKNVHRKWIGGREYLDYVSISGLQPPFGA